jgi:DNA-binding NarL/FixJ family response regulator
MNRLLVVDDLQILGAGLKNLLSKEEALEVYGFSTQDESALVDEIWRVRPDTIILMAESQLTTPVRLLTLLPDYGRLRIIFLNLDNNIFEIYGRQQITVEDWSSFRTNLRPD